MRLSRYITVLVMLSIVSLSGCVQKEGNVTEAKSGETAQSGAVAVAEVKIGALQSLTGDLGTYGGPMTDAIKLAVKEINANGGIMGKDLDLLAEDDQTSEVPAVDAANKLIKVDKVAAVIGATGSGPSMSVIDIVTGNGILQISSSNTGVEFTTYNDRDLYFRTATSDALQGAAMAKFASEKGYKTASTIVINNPYGVGFEDVFKKSFEASGGKVLKSIRYDPAQTIFDSDVANAASAKPDFVMFVSYPETGSLILKTAYEKGYLKSMPWLMSEGLMAEKLADLVGKDKDGNYIVAGMQGLTPDPSAGGAAYEAFRAKYLKEYGREPTIYCSNSYDATALVALAIEQAKNTSGAAIAQSLRSVANPPGVEVSDIGEALKLVREGNEINYQGSCGEITFDEHGDVNGAYSIWLVADNGTISLGEKIAV